MNHVTSRHPLPSLVAHVLNDGTHYIDNLFASAWKSLNLNRRLEAAGFTKRSGIEVTETVFVLMVWRWLNVSSIAVFCRTALSVFSRANKDVLYDFLKREDIHWRKLNLHTAKALYQQHALNHSQVRAYVLDDSIKARRGKKMEDVSSHYDHTTNRHVMGQQVLTLGLATEEAFVPLDSQIYVSSKKAHTLNRRHKDRRSIGARRYREATMRSKPQMALGMMKRAMRCGVQADYLVADAWFGTKTMIRAAYELGVCAVLRMKKGAMKYRVLFLTLFRNGFPGLFLIDAGSISHIAPSSSESGARTCTGVAVVAMIPAVVTKMGGHRARRCRTGGGCRCWGGRGFRTRSRRRGGRRDRAACEGTDLRSCAARRSSG